MLSEIRKKHNLNIISEVRDASHVDEVIEHVDIIQSGPKELNTFEDMNSEDHVEKV